MNIPLGADQGISMNSEQ